MFPSLQAALDRSRQLIRNLGTVDPRGDRAADATVLDRLTDRARLLPPTDEAAMLELYFEIRALTRQRALENPLVSGHRIVFMERRRAVGYMFYEYLGWYYAFADPAGADPYPLPGYQLALENSSVKYHTFHLFALDAEGAGLRQLTDGPYDDFDPCPPPDGGIAFMSMRRGSKLRCGGGSPETVFTLHRMDEEGTLPRTLSFHETHEWHPSLLQDGRMVYTRWDYVDRNAAKFHGLWTCNLDGSNVVRPCSPGIRSG